jgi:hypothetical protein
MGNSPTSVRHLIESGYMFIPIDTSLVDAAVSAWKRLILDMRDLTEGFPVVRTGEPEPDLGLVVRPPDTGGDYKYFFHLAHDFCFYMTPMQKKEFGQYLAEFTALDTLRKHLNDVAFKIGNHLDTEYQHVFTERLLPNLRSCTRFSRPYATTTLRTLWYPPAPNQVGASIHIDRNLFSIHVGDEGGTLFAYDTELGANPRSILPSPGYAVVFFGVKALYLSDGRVQPLWHGSTIEGGVDRLAMVQFMQADIGMETPRAKEAFHAFYERV